jgi:hypothetical protein
MMSKLRDLDKFDSVLDEHFSDDRSVKIGSTLTGITRSVETRSKISAGHKGKPKSPDAIAKGIQTRKDNGYTVSDETRAKLSEAGQGREVSDETRAKIGAKNKGRKLPPKSKETRAKLSQSLQGREGYWAGKQQSAESCAKRSESLKGRTLSKEHSSKISASKKGKPCTNDKRKPIVVPFGVFRSRKEAVEAGTALDIINVAKKIDANLKKDPASYYYISKEEYIMLTGKEL